jgi:hypothetical protein
MKLLWEIINFKKVDINFQRNIFNELSRFLE